MFTSSDRPLDTAVAAPGDGARLRFVAARIVRGPFGMSRAEVEFERSDGAMFVGRQEGTACPGGDLRLAALATFAVLGEAAQEPVRFELIGAKSVRAFDTTVIMVGAHVHLHGSPTRVVGAAIVSSSEVEATVRATLHAVNRLVSPLVGPLTADD